jgi:hypothetical protein
MADIDLKTLTPDTSLPTTGFLFGADSQATASPSVYSTQAVATTLLGSTVLTGDTLTGSSAPVLNLTQTWSNISTVFTGVKLNVTNTNSAAASLLMDLQVGGTSLFSVGKAGNATAPSGSAAVPSYAISAAGLYSRASVRLNFAFSGTDAGVEIGPTVLALQNTASLVWTSGTLPSSGQDLFLTRKGAANLQLGAADAVTPVLQTLSVQSIVGGVSTDASAAAYPFTITGAQGTGTGAGGSIIFKVAPAGSTGMAQNALSTVLSVVPGAAGGSILASRALITSYGTSTNTGLQGMCSLGHDTTSGTLVVGAPSGIPTVSVVSGGRFGFSSGSNFNWADADTFLARDAANTLAQRNGVNAQTFNLYHTYTDASNYERGIFTWVSNILTIGTDKLGTGSNRGLAFCYGAAATRVADYAISNNGAWTFSNFVVSAGATVGLGIGISASTLLRLQAGTTSVSPLRLEPGVAPTSPVNGDIWFDGADIKMRIGGVTKTFTLI